MARPFSRVKVIGEGTHDFLGNKSSGVAVFKVGHRGKKGASFRKRGHNDNFKEYHFIHNGCHFSSIFAKNNQTLEKYINRCIGWGNLSKWPKFIDFVREGGRY